MVKLLEGKFATKCAQDFVDWYVKCGMDPKLANAFLGTDYTFEFKFVDAAEKCLLLKHDYPADPSYNFSGVLIEGKDCCMTLPEPFGKLTVSSGWMCN